MSDFNVTVQEEDMITAQTDVFNVPSVPRLGDVGDVDTTSLDNGSVLVYKTNNNKWTSTRTLDLQNLEGGEF
jgi:hypothetical protein